jgi:hypothetical protein
MAYKQAVLLNETEPGDSPLEKPLDIALTLSLADLKAQFMDPQSGRVDYRAIGRAEAFKEYEDLASRLRGFDLYSLQDRDQRLAFWINIYNTSVIHGVIQLGLQRSVREFSGFFDRISLEIGGYQFSLNDMEHGILRGNKRPPYRIRRPFKKQDPRFRFAVRPLDPRIHFALVCGARSCPPVGYYEPDRIDQQLELAAKSFINSSYVQIVQDDMSISVSRILKWYKADFGGSKASLLNTILRYLDDGGERAFLAENEDRVRIRYQPYDWRLNE